MTGPGRESVPPRMHGGKPSGDALSVVSQHDEADIVREVLGKLRENVPWCVEFGAGDGKKDSNTWDLVQDQGYSVVLIEPQTERFRGIAKNYGENDRVHAFNCFVEHQGDGSLDRILAQTPIPQRFDFLSIDVDGNDLPLWKTLEKYRPRLVCIEFNQSIPPWINFAQDYDPRATRGASIKSITDFAATWDYQLAFANRTNLFFVANEDFEDLGLERKGPMELFPNYDALTVLGSSYAGEIFILGNRANIWHSIEYKSRKMQILPRALREFPPRMSRLHRFFWRLWKTYWQPRTSWGSIKSLLRRN